MFREVHRVHEKLSSCGTHIEHIVSVHDLFRASSGSPLNSASRNRTTSTGGFVRDVNAQTIRASAVHQRTPEGKRRAALLRRDEGCARPALEIGHPSSDHRARGA